MPRIPALPLAALLAGASGAAAASCAPAYSPGGSYASGDRASASTSTTESCVPGTAGCSATCAPGSAGCPASGTKTVTVTHNYSCVANEYSRYCGTDGYAPGTTWLAWTREGACTGTAASTTTTCLRATLAGVDASPSPDAAGAISICTETDADTSAVKLVATGLVPGSSGNIHLAFGTCANVAGAAARGDKSPAEGSEPYATDSAGYGTADGTWRSGLAGELAVLYDADDVPVACGALATGAALTSADDIPAAWTGGPGCPAAFASGADYDTGDVASVSEGAYSTVYKCAGAPPLNQFCGRAGYEPGSGQHSGSVWTSLGSCAGAMAPTAAPAYVTLPDAGGCPGAWAAGAAYEEGDRVAVAGRVYVCKAFPMNGWCGQAGYAPGGDDTPWGHAWTLAGHCAGTITPTASPVFDPATSVGGCPSAYASGATYEAGDRVSVTVSAAPLRRVAYQCKTWPQSGYCAQRAPTAFGGDMGWTLLGSCDGTIAPTASPVFVALAEVAGGCPTAYNKAVTTYAEGDRVALVASTTPERKIVYACKGWPDTLFCNQGEAYAPGTQYGNMAWDLKGYCAGSIAPTTAPIAFVGTCTYTKNVVNAGAGVPATCSPGSSPDCSCTTTAGTTTCTRPTNTVTPTQVDVGAYRAGVDYDAGDVVRVGAKRFKCKEYPFYLWCRMPAYAPTLQSNGIWGSAWTEDGVCEATIEDLLGLRFLAPSEIATAFDKTEGAVVVRHGLVLYEAEGVVTTIEEHYSSQLPLPISYDEFQRMCVTKCQRNAKCAAVTVTVFEMNAPDYFCYLTADAEVRGVKTAQLSSSSVASDTVYVKKGSTVNSVTPCKVEYAELSRSFACATCLQEVPPATCDSLYGPDCGGLLTMDSNTDFYDKVVPAASCVSGYGGNATACLECTTKNLLSVSLSAVAETICTENDELNLVHGLCKEECDTPLVPRACEGQLQKGALCVSGAPLIRTGANWLLGAINTPYACPVAPTTTTCLGTTLAAVSTTLAPNAAGTLSICTVTQGDVSSVSLNMAATGLTVSAFGSIQLSDGNCADPVSSSTSGLVLGDYTSDSSGNGAADFTSPASGNAGLIVSLYTDAGPIACGVLG